MVLSDKIISEYNEAMNRINLINGNSWSSNAYVNATPDGFTEFLKIKERVLLTAKNTSPSQGPSSIPLLTEEAAQFMELLEQMQTNTVISQYIDLYLSPIALGDINFRLGNVMGVKNDFSTSRITDEFGNIYTTTNFSTDLKCYSTLPSGEYYDIKEHYVNLFFPPYQPSNSKGDAEIDTSLAWFEKYRNKFEEDDKERQDFSTKFLVRSPIEATFRTPGFKLVNDNIIFLQHLFEGLSGVVSTYMTEWDMSLYMQEKLMTTFKDENMTIDSFMWLTYRLREDNPYGFNTDQELSSIATVNYAVSKIKNTNIIPWLPNEHPLAKWWRPYIESIDTSRKVPYFYELLAKMPNKLAEFPYCDVPTITPKTNLDKKFLSKSLSGHRADLYERIRFEDFRGSVLSGWDFFSKMATYQTLYINSGDGVNEVDNAVLDNYLSNGSKYNLAQLIDSIKSMDDGTTEENIESKKTIDLGDDISNGSGGIGGYSDISIMGCPIPGSKLLKMFLNKSSIESSANKSSNTQSENRSKGLTSFFASPKVEDNNSGTMSQDPNLQAGGAETDVLITPEGEEIKYLTDEPENTKYSSFDGLSPFNPVFFGGPHGLYKSPETLQGYFESGNIFLRNSPRISGFYGKNRWSLIEKSINADNYCSNYNQFYDGVEEAYFNKDRGVKDLQSRSPTSAFTLLKNGLIWTFKRKVSFWTNRIPGPKGSLDIRTAIPVRDYNRSGRSIYSYKDYIINTFYPNEEKLYGDAFYDITDGWRVAVRRYYDQSCIKDLLYSGTTGWSSWADCWCNCHNHQWNIPVSELNIGNSYSSWGYHDKYRTESSEFNSRNNYYTYVTYDFYGRESYHYIPRKLPAYQQIVDTKFKYFGRGRTTYLWGGNIGRSGGDLRQFRNRRYGWAETYINWRLVDGFIADVNMHDMPYLKWYINRVKFREYDVSISWSTGWPGFWRSIWNWLKGGPRNVRTLSYSVTALPPNDCYVLRTDNNNYYYGTDGGGQSTFGDVINSEIVNKFMAQKGNIYNYTNHDALFCETNDNGEYVRIFSSRLRFQERKIIIYRWEVVRTWRERERCRWRTKYAWGWVPRTFYKPFVEVELDKIPTFMSLCSYSAPRDMTGRDFIPKAVANNSNVSSYQSSHPAHIRESSLLRYTWNSGYHPVNGEIDRTDSYEGLMGVGILTKIQGIDSALTSKSLDTDYTPGIDYDTNFHADWIKYINVKNSNNTLCSGGYKSTQSILPAINVKRQCTSIKGWYWNSNGPYDADKSIIYNGKTPIIEYYDMPSKLESAINRSLLTLTMYMYEAELYNYSNWHNVHLSDPFRLFYNTMVRQLSYLENCLNVVNSSTIENMHLILNNSVDKNIIKTSKEFPVINEAVSKIVRDERAHFEFWIYLANGLVYNKEMSTKSSELFIQSLTNRINKYKKTLSTSLAKKFIANNDIYTYDDYYKAFKDVDEFSKYLKDDRIDFLGNGVILNPELKIDGGVGEYQNKSSDGYKAFENIGIEEFFYIYLQLLYQYRRYFINKRFNKIDGTYWHLRHYEHLASYTLSKANTIKMPDLNNISGQHAKTLPVIAYLLNNTPDDKSLAMIDEIDPLDEDKIKWVFHKVEYYNGKESRLKRIVDVNYGDINNPKLGRPGCYWEDPNGAIIIELLNGKKAYKPYTFNYRLLSDDVKLSDDTIENIKIEQNSGESRESFEKFKKANEHKIINDSGCSKEDAFHISWEHDKSSSDNIDYHILEIVQKDGSTVRTSSVWFDYFIGIDPNKLTKEAIESGDIKQDIICKAGTKMDLWAVRIPDSKMPPVKHFTKNPALVPVFKEEVEDLEIGVDPILGGVLSYTLWPIKEKQNGSFIPEEYSVLKLPEIPD